MTQNSGNSPRLVAFQYRDFRLLWFGQIISTIGSNMQLIAVNWHIYELLRDEVYVLNLLGYTFDLNAGALGLGTLGLARVIPIILFALVGGMIADVFDRRRVMIWTNLTQTVVAALLSGITFTGNDSVTAIYLLTSAGAAAAAFQQPAQQSLIPNLVPRKHLANAVSLNTLQWQSATIAGPALAGVLVSIFSLGLVYAIDALSFAGVIVALLLMNYRSQGNNTNTTGLGWPAIVEGWKFTYNSELIWSTMLLDFFATFFSTARPSSKYCGLN
ncbi:MAG: MFS transporter, partial [Chloroflexota bacterium]